MTTNSYSYRGNPEPTGCFRCGLTLGFVAGIVMGVIAMLFTLWLRGTL